jgi:tetraacyldisaccharide 4'-kinase
MKLLLPFSWLYAVAMQLRNRLFDWGVLKSENVGVPVLSVGNLTVGGTGKTPLVEYIVRHLLQQGKRVAVVSRGYKRKSSGVVVVSDGKRVLVTAEQGGDEPVQVAWKFREAIVVVGERRVEAAREATHLGAEAIVVDDGFQHRYLQRGLDVVVVDATKDILKDVVLPAGRMREPLSGLRRAHLVAFSNADEAVLSQADREAKLRTRFAGSFVHFRYVVQDVRRASDDGSASLEVVKRMRLLAFSGIGNHEAFEEELRRNGFAPLSDMRFSDHHQFSDGDVQMLASFARGLSADAAITTEKDVVRLRANTALAGKLFSEIPVFYLRIEVEFLGGKEVLHSYIEHWLRGESIT